VADRLVLICHAATAATRAAAFGLDEPLDQAGLAAARGVVLTPRADRFLTSPALRARQTADALALDARVDEALRDADPGGWAGRSLDELDPAAVAAWLGGAAPPGGESGEDVRERVRVLLGNGGVTIAVTHAAVIRALVVEVLGAPTAAARRVEVAPLTRTVLAGGPRRWALRMVAAPLLSR
jgi:broad specificity phosphatase PhoE